MDKDLDFLRSPLIAHRGMHNIKQNIPENSLKSFEMAIFHGYTIELDLHILKDGTIIVFHDDNLKRMTGINKNLRDVTYDEIKNLKLQNTDCHIPLFKEVLHLVNGAVPLLIELKTDVSVGRLEKKAMELIRDYNGKYAIQSFRPASIYWFRMHYPDVVRGLLSSDSSKKNIFNKILNFFICPDFLSYDISVLPNELVEDFRKNHLVLGWTIRNNSDLEKAENYCDNFICENIESLDIK